MRVTFKRKLAKFGGSYRITIPKEIIDAIEGLLEFNPQKRWNFEEVVKRLSSNDKVVKIYITI